MNIPVPQPTVSSTPRIMNLRDPLVKMSKSDTTKQDGVLCIFDEPDIIVQKLRRAVTETDFSLDPVFVQNSPSLKNLVNIASGLCGCSVADFLEQVGHLQTFAALKDYIADLVVSHFSDQRLHLERLKSDMFGTRCIIEKCEEAVRLVAAKNYDSFLSSFQLK